MPTTATPPRPRESARAQRDALAAAWRAALAPTGFAPHDAAGLDARFRALADEVRALLAAEPLDRPRARAVGAALVGLRYTHPDALGRTHEVLATHLPAGRLPAARAPRLAALLGELAAGFCAAARDAVLAEQEEIHAALLAACERAEAARRDGDARYRAVVEQAAEGILLVDAASRRVVEANAAAQRLLGYSGAELGALTLYDLVADDRASVDRHGACILAEGAQVLGERRYRRKDGTTIAVEARANVVTVAGRAVFCVLLHDLAARDAAEAALRRLRAAVGHAPVLCFACDRAGVITLAEGRGWAALDRRPADLVDRSVWAAASEAPALPDALRRALAGEGGVATVAVRGVALELHCAPLRDEAGAVAGAVGLALDVTARVAAEAAVRRLTVRPSAQQATLLRLLARPELCYREIAAALTIEPETVRSHLKHLAEKLGVPARREAVVAAARECGLLPPAPPPSR